MKPSVCESVLHVHASVCGVLSSKKVVYLNFFCCFFFFWPNLARSVCCAEFRN